MGKREEAGHTGRSLVVVVHPVASFELEIFAVFRVDYIAVIAASPLRAFQLYVALFHGILLQFFQRQLAGTAGVFGYVVYLVRIFLDGLDALFHVFAALRVVFRLERETYAFVVLPVGIGAVKFDEMRGLFQERSADRLEQQGFPVFDLRPVAAGGQNGQSDRRKNK